MATAAELRTGQIILYNSRPHRITAITSHRDQVHGRLYMLELESPSGKVRLTVREGAEFTTR
jgi:translation elongation factor P/translation initiation factor 5A